MNRLAELLPELETVPKFSELAGLLLGLLGPMGTSKLPVQDHVLSKLLSQNPGLVWPEAGRHGPGW